MLRRKHRMKFWALYEKYKDPVFLYAYNLYKDTDIAERIAISTYVELYKSSTLRKISDVDSDETKRYIARIVIKQGMKHNKKP